mmetsp:Transcript_33141/g.53403  ORF Transcript_33141/g.53403 Transcript_33141/m.53403 type:complete len:92 (+) Transcript_33141:285-560(+)
MLPSTQHPPAFSRAACSEMQQICESLSVTRAQYHGRRTYHNLRGPGLGSISRHGLLLGAAAHAMANLSSRILLQQEARTHDKRSMHEHRDK